MKLAFATAAAVLSLSTGAHAQVFTQDFTFTTDGFAGGTRAATASDEQYLELANSAESIFSYDTSGLTGLSVSFDLYGLQSVDGNGPAGGPDNFLIYLKGAATPTYSINIANYDSGGNSQDFNGDLTQSGPGHSFAAFTGAAARGTLGYGTGLYGDSTYRITFALPDAATTSIRFIGATNEAATEPFGGLGGNEAYGIDNFNLFGTRATGTGNGAVPEPATWAMMLAGFGALGVARRRRGGAMRPARLPARVLR